MRRTFVYKFTNGSFIYNLKKTACTEFTRVVKIWFVLMEFFKTYKQSFQICIHEWKIHLWVLKNSVFTWTYMCWVWCKEFLKAFCRHEESQLNTFLILPLHNFYIEGKSVGNDWIVCWLGPSNTNLILHLIPLSAPKEISVHLFWF